MSTYSSQDIGNHAVELANDIERLCRGRPTASVYIAFSMILGNCAASAPKPDFEEMMALVERTAFDEFKRRVS